MIKLTPEEFDTLRKILNQIPTTVWREIEKNISLQDLEALKFKIWYDPKI